MTPTYSEIQKFVQRRNGFVPTLGWIAHVKALSGLPTRRATHRAGQGDPPARPSTQGASAGVTPALLFGVDIDRDKRIDCYIDYFGGGAERATSSLPSGDAGNARRVGRARREAARTRPPSRGGAGTAGPQTKVQ